MAPIPTPRLPLWLRALHSSARYAATASVRGLLVAEIQVFVPYRIHPSIHPVRSRIVAIRRDFARASRPFLAERIVM